MTSSSPTLRQPSLERIPIAHPLVVLGSLSVIGAMMYRAFSTDFREPDFWTSFAVSTLIVVIGSASRRREARRPPAAIVQPAPRHLDL